MRCDSCEKAAFEAHMCRTCLARTIEKRARKALSKAKIRKGMKAAIVNDGSCAGQVNAYLADKLLTITKNKVFKKLPKSRFDLILLPVTADTEAQDFLDFMLLSKGKKRAASLNLLGESLASELEAYAKTKRIKYHAAKDKTSLIQELEKGYEGTTFSLAKSSRELKWRS